MGGCRAPGRCHTPDVVHSQNIVQVTCPLENRVCEGRSMQVYHTVNLFILGDCPCWCVDLQLGRIADVNSQLWVCQNMHEVLCGA